jgi:hypothetical protein
MWASIGLVLGGSEKPNKKRCKEKWLVDFETFDVNGRSENEDMETEDQANCWLGEKRSEGLWMNWTTLWLLLRREAANIELMIWWGGGFQQPSG